MLHSGSNTASHSTNWMNSNPAGRTLKSFPPSFGNHRAKPQAVMQNVGRSRETALHIDGTRQRPSPGPLLHPKSLGFDQTDLHFQRGETESLDDLMDSLPSQEKAGNPDRAMSTKQHHEYYGAVIHRLMALYNRCDYAILQRESELEALHTERSQVWEQLSILLARFFPQSLAEAANESSSRELDADSMVGDLALDPTRLRCADVQYFSRPLNTQHISTSLTGKSKVPANSVSSMEISGSKDFGVAPDKHCSPNPERDHPTPEVSCEENHQSECSVRDRVILFENHMKTEKENMHREGDAAKTRQKVAKDHSDEWASNSSTKTKCVGDSQVFAEDAKTTKKSEHTTQRPDSNQSVSRATQNSPGHLRPGRSKGDMIDAASTASKEVKPHNPLFELWEERAKTPMKKPTKLHSKPRAFLVQEEERTVRHTPLSADPTREAKPNTALKTSGCSFSLGALVLARVLSLKPRSSHSQAMEGSRTQSESVPSTSRTASLPASPQSVTRALADKGRDLCQKALEMSGNNNELNNKDHPTPIELPCEALPAAPSLETPMTKEVPSPVLPDSDSGSGSNQLSISNHFGKDERTSEEEPHTVIVDIGAYQLTQVRVWRDGGVGSVRIREATTGSHGGRWRRCGPSLIKHVVGNSVVTKAIQSVITKPLSELPKNSEFWAFLSEHNIATTKDRVLISVHPLLSRSDQQSLAEWYFGIGVRGVTMIPSLELESFQSKSPTGLVVSVGHFDTRVAQVYEGQILADTVRCTGIGGRNIADEVATNKNRGYTERRLVQDGLAWLNENPETVTEGLENIVRQIATAVAASIENCDPDLIAHVSSNVVLAGKVVEHKGVRECIKQHILSVFRMKGWEPAGVTFSISSRPGQEVVEGGVQVMSENFAHRTKGAWLSEDRYSREGISRLGWV